MNEIDISWYNELIEDCKTIIVETSFASRWAIVEGYWNLGQRLREDMNLEKYSREKPELLKRVAESLNISERTLYYSMQFYDKFPDLSMLPEGKDVSWKKIVTKYLPEAREGKPSLPREFKNAEPITPNELMDFLSENEDIYVKVYLQEGQKIFKIRR
jgi:hypothetical protein